VTVDFTAPCTKYFYYYYYYCYYYYYYYYYEWMKISSNFFFGPIASSF